MEGIILWIIVLGIAIGYTILSIIGAIKSHRDFEIDIRNKQLKEAIISFFAVIVSLYFIICFS